MNFAFRFAVSAMVLCGSLSLVGCDDSAQRTVQETDEYRFDDMAAQAAAETALSEVEE